MAISSFLAPSAIAKPGVCTSSTRPASPYEGQVIYETDTDKVLVWNGSAWYANWNMPWGVVGLFTATSAWGTSSTHTTFQDMDASLSISEINGRRYRVSYEGHAYPNGGLQGMGYNIMRSTTVLKFIEIPSGRLSTSNASTFGDAYVYTSTSTGTVTYKMQLRAFASNTQVQCYGSSSNTRQFWVEDVGPA